jgi:hypothetical protein
MQSRVTYTERGLVRPKPSKGLQTVKGWDIVTPSYLSGQECQSLSQGDVVKRRIEVTINN